MTALYLTDRALADLDEIERYSITNWGPAVALKYLSDLGTALARLEANPGLLLERAEYSGRLRFYAVREHMLVCDAIGGRIYVLTIWHGAMDFLGRLERLEPQLVQESELLARRIEEGEA